jgi:hypothetical protein
VLLTIGAVAGCSDDGGGGPETDGGGADTGTLFPDLGQPPDLGQKLPCDSEWRDAISPQKKVTTGQVSSNTAGSITKAFVDATAGGSGQSHLYPFVYLSLADGKRVDIDDYAARTSKAWDLAFRRTVIRVNGGDSGPGQGAVAIQANTTLDKVTAVPAAGQFGTDDFLDAQCNIKRDAISNIRTAFGGSAGVWYNYGSGTHAVTPKPDVYVVRTASGKHYKLVIDTYYNASNVGGHFTLRWSPLP